MTIENFEHTSEALSELKQSIQNLENVCKQVKTSTLNQMEAYQNSAMQNGVKVEALKAALETTVQKIDATSQKIDEVIRQNGTNHNTN